MMILFLRNQEDRIYVPCKLLHISFVLLVGEVCIMQLFILACFVRSIHRIYVHETVHLLEIVFQIIIPLVLNMSQNSPIILIAGQKKCGKSSIVDVVFKRMSVYNTFFLDTNASLKKYTSTMNPFLEYNVWELSSDINEVRAEMLNIQPYIHQIAVFIYVFNLEVRFESHFQ